MLCVSPRLNPLSENFTTLHQVYLKCVMQYGHNPFETSRCWFYHHYIIITDSSKKCLQFRKNNKKKRVSTSLYYLDLYHLSVICFTCKQAFVLSFYKMAVKPNKLVSWCRQIGEQNRVAQAFPDWWIMRSATLLLLYQGAWASIVTKKTFLLFLKKKNKQTQNSGIFCVTHIKWSLLRWCQGLEPINHKVKI